MANRRQRKVPGGTNSPGNPVMIKCRDCGADFSVDLPACPYCGSENVPASVKEQYEYLQEVKNRKVDAGSMGKAAAKTMNRKITVVALIAAAALLLFIGFYVGKQQADSEKRQEQRKVDIQQLEELYQKNDFAAIKEILDKDDLLYSSSYQKYTELARAYYYITEGCDSIDHAVVMFESSMRTGYEFDMVTSLDFGLDWNFDGLRMLKALEDAGYLNDEESGVEYIRNISYKTLRGKLKLTDEDIAKGIAISAKNDYSGENQYAEIAETVVVNLGG